MNLKRTLLYTLLATTLAAAPALAGYTSGGTFVVKAAGVTLVDNGGAICQGMNGDGIGGGCLKFPPAVPRDPTGTVGGAFVRVHDDQVGDNVAFQVCIDNNGDGVCGGQFLPTDKCQDQIFFSHDDAGRFFNPLGPLPTSSIEGCGNAFQGYVVLLCEGAHLPREATTPHAHKLTSGTISLAPEGSGYGDFCGGNGGGSAGLNTNSAAKAYKVE